MSSFRFPTLFISHGTPMHAFGEDRFQNMLSDFSQSIPKPKAIIVLSAHSVSSDKIHVLRTEKNFIQHDFGGFPEDLYNIQYECPGDPAEAEKIAALFKDAGFETVFDERAPLDHGIWIPLLHLYPKGDVPVVRVSLPLSFQPAQILKMGHAVAKLRELGAMILGSGGAVHNLRELKWEKKVSEGKPWAHQFEEWLIHTLQKKDVEELLAADEQPIFKKAHPSQEHFLPLLFVVGAALKGDEVQILNRGVEYDTLSMLTFSLNQPTTPSLH
jgi:4,5-DOPA dioxygenase extradiol